MTTGALPRWVDPPEGWKYGFPAIWKPVECPDLRQWFLDKGYPEEHIELAMKWSRYWAVD